MLKLCDCIGADHPPIGNNVKVVDADSLSDSIDYCNQRFDVSRVSRPHLATNWLAFIVYNSPDNHQIQIGSVVFAKTSLADGCIALALKVDGRGIEKNQIQTGEQIPLIEENRLLDQILVTPDSKQRGGLLIIDRFSQKSHRPVKMMQIQLLCVADVVVSAPLFAKAIRARYHQPVQNSQKNGSFNIKFKSAIY